jgi:hypothetical protein
MPRALASPPPATLERLHRLAAAVVALAVLVNALIAGRTMAGDWDIVVHGVIGNVVFVLTLGALALAVAARAGRATVIAAVVLLALVFAQVGLGYSGRESLEARAWHLPNGVAIFGLAVWMASGGRRSARDLMR